jgi:small conductance mechanosensitive channel
VADMQDIWGRINGYVVQSAISLLYAVLIFIIGKWAAQFLAKMAEKSLERAKVNKTLASFTKNVVYFGMLIFVFIAALNKVGIQTNSFVALIGAAGLAVGLALQGSLANFAAGVMIILFQPFQVGDEIETGGVSGVVEEIQIFNIVIGAADNKRVIIPNAKVTGDKIVVSKKPCK